MAITTTSILPAPIQQQFDMKLLSRKIPDLVHNQFAMKKRMMDRNGQIIRFRRYNTLQTAVVPLGPSGVTPPPQTLSALDIDAKIEWYGTYVLITDQVSLINEDPVLNETASILAQCARETEDELTRNMLQATATAINCVSGANGDNPTNLTFADILAASTTLTNNSARKITEEILGEDKFGSGPVREAFWVMAHTALIPNLEACQGFLQRAQYPANYSTLSSEYGTIANSRWVLSQRGSTSLNASGLGATVYNCFMTGKEAYSCIDLEGAFLQFIYRPLGFGNDVLFQRQACGFKFASAQRILNDQWILNLRTTLS